MKVLRVCVFHGWGITMFRTKNVLFGDHNLMNQSLHVRIETLALFITVFTVFTFSQQKERNRKLDTAQKGTPVATEAAAKDEQDAKEEGDPLFRGMKYR